jgi:uncharacterized protein (DUF433 family)
MIAFENKPQIGKGIYVTRDVANILNISYEKANRWITSLWDGKLGKQFQEKYSWKIDDSRAISFHTLIELFVMGQFYEAGVKSKEVLLAHQEMSKAFETRFPFALKTVMEGISFDPKTKKIYWDVDGIPVNLNGTKQLNIPFIKLLLKRLDFDQSDMASRFWPMGKENSVVVDPHRKFGHPILDGRNIYPETLYGQYKAGESIPFIAYIFEITEKEVQDAIAFCEAA